MDRSAARRVRRDLDDALSRANALDVTSVLVASALITWLLELVAGTATAAGSSLGLVLIALGALLVVGRASFAWRHGGSCR